jgi:hypothetical protein
MEQFETANSTLRGTVEKIGNVWRAQITTSGRWTSGLTVAVATSGHPTEAEAQAALDLYFNQLRA